MAKHARVRVRARRTRKHDPRLFRIVVSLAISVVAVLAGSSAVSQPSAAVGVPSDVELTRSGGIVVTKPGTVIDAREVRGYILVKADNVTIKRTRVVYGGYHSIRVFPGVTGTVVEDSEIVCGNASRTNGLVFGNYTARRVDVSGCRNSFMHSASAPAVIIDSRADGEVINVHPDTDPRPTPTSSLTASPTPSPTETSPDPEATATGSPTTGPTADPTASPPDPSPSAPDGTKSPDPSDTPEPPTSPEPTAEPEPTTEPEPTSDPQPPHEGFPDESTTGVPDDVTLEKSGSVTTTRDGQVIENLEITGTISVKHDDVTIRNVRVRATDRYGVYVPNTLAGQVSGLLIEDSELIGISGERSSGIAPWGSWTARRLDVSGFQDGVKVGTDQVLEDSWIHDLYRPDGAHNDGIQSTGGRNVVIRGNRIEGRWQGQTSAIIIQSNNKPVERYVIENNLLSGGNYTLYLRDKGTGHGAPRDITVRNNVWVDGSWEYGPISLDRGSNWTWENNRTDTGDPVG